MTFAGDDIAVFFPTAEAIAATLQGGTTVYGYFDDPSLDQLGVAGANPTFECAAADVSDANVNQTLTISGTAYTIRKRDRQDDAAWVVLQLQAP